MGVAGPSPPAVVSLATRCASLFPADVRARGWTLQRKGHVEVLSASPKDIRARVHDGVDTFSVRVVDEGRTLSLGCECVSFRRAGSCLHGWAAILAAESGPAPHSEVSGRSGPLDRREPRPTPQDEGASPAGELWYLVDLASSIVKHTLVLVVARDRPAVRKGSAPKWKRAPLTDAVVLALRDEDDVAIVGALRGASITVVPEISQYTLSRSGRDLLFPLLARTGRCRLLRDAAEEDPAPLPFDEGGPWQLHLRVREATGDDWELVGVLRRDGREVPLGAPPLVLEGGIFLGPDGLARYDDGGAASWLSLLRQHGRFHIGASRRQSFVEEVYALARLPSLELPAGWALPQVAVSPVPRVRVRPPSDGGAATSPIVFAELGFGYDGFVVPSRRPGAVALDAAGRRLVQRDRKAEAAARERLLALEFRPLTSPGARAAPEGADLQIAAARLPAAVRTLLADGWSVEADGKLYRRAGKLRVGVSSGIDWFDVSAAVDFDGVPARAEAVLEALRRRQTTVVLDDGTLGLLPEEWLSRFGLIADLGAIQDGRLRFQKAQASMLDALLAAEPEADVDAAFARARDALRESATLAPADPPPGFGTELRPYQREGLGWLLFLERLGFGGCLADDMGLGKTVQVLALLAGRKERHAAAHAASRGKGKGKTKPPSMKPALVVAPRSLIFNWKSEAARFTPKLRLLDHTGASRLPPGAHFEDHDIVLTTYGTLRRDALELARLELGYVILDEAQAIKNERSDTAKAARLLRADHRLALSGTPVENHLGELWSLFEFLNPGVLGRARAFHAAASSPGMLSPESIALLSAALKPFLLRRTKAQVASDLPARTEETRMVELGPEQRALYDDLRDHYRASLQKRVRTEGLGKSRMHVLEALLRLRQAACHPGLVDPALRDAPSAKLEALFDELPSLREKGQKALVFSQFVSLLALVRARLDAEGVPYEYLDGQTEDRAARVERFQSDPACPLFLISLKAGGVGLNLTAAEYVFLLDPWWNPAVEAQAIDRAHRIGQASPVFAYRLIAAGTIEERIAELQGTKRKLAESVIEGDGALLRDLSEDDLAKLLS
jgi:superfamily II DNA or RNA helicase